MYTWEEEQRRNRKPHAYKGMTSSEDTDGDHKVQEGASSNPRFRKKPQKSGEHFLGHKEGVSSSEGEHQSTNAGVTGAPMGK